MNTINGKIFAAEAIENSNLIKLSIDVEITQEQWDETFKLRFGEHITLHYDE